MNSIPEEKIPVLVAGALGKMGSEVIRAVVSSEECELVAAIDNSQDKQGSDIGIALGLKEQKVNAQAFASIKKKVASDGKQE